MFKLLNNYSIGGSLVGLMEASSAAEFYCLRVLPLSLGVVCSNFSVSMTAVSMRVTCLSLDTQDHLPLVAQTWSRRQVSIVGHVLANMLLFLLLRLQQHLYPDAVRWVDCIPNGALMSDGMPDNSLGKSSVRFSLSCPRSCWVC